MNPGRLRITHLFLLGITLSRAEAFYKDILGLEVFERAKNYILFNSGGCILGAQPNALGIPIDTSEFIIFEIFSDLDICIVNLKNRGIRFYESSEEKKKGRVAWFSGPNHHLHCIRQVTPNYNGPIASISSLAPDPRLAYYFLAVDDLKVAISFYREMLGLPLIETREGLYALFNAGGIILGLRQGKDAGAGVDAPSWAVFETAHFDELYQKLRQGDVNPLGVRTEPHGRVGWFLASGGYMQSLHDPEPEYALDAIIKREPIFD